VIDAGASPVDAGLPNDAGAAIDAGIIDAGTMDAGAPFDAGVSIDAGSRPDAGAPPDAGNIDAGSVIPPADAGSARDAGTGTPQMPTGCGCTTSPSALWLIAGVVLVLSRRRRARTAA